MQFGLVTPFGCFFVWPGGKDLSDLYCKRALAEWPSPVGLQGPQSAGAMFASSRMLIVPNLQVRPQGSFLRWFHLKKLHAVAASKGGKVQVACQVLQTAALSRRRHHQVTTEPWGIEERPEKDDLCCH